MWDLFLVVCGLRIAQASVVVAHRLRCPKARGISGRQPGIKPMSPALRGILNHWTTREVLPVLIVDASFYSKTLPRVSCRKPGPVGLGKKRNPLARVIKSSGWRGRAPGKRTRLLKLCHQDKHLPILAPFFFI